MKWKYSSGIDKNVINGSNVSYYTIRRLRITRTYLVQMSKIDIIIENEATMYALSANVPKSYR